MHPIARIAHIGNSPHSLRLSLTGLMRGLAWLIVSLIEAGTFAWQCAGEVEYEDAEVSE